MSGGRCSSSTDEQNQALTERCGTNSLIEAKGEIPRAPAPSKSAMLIYDAELRERFGLDAEMMIDAMDRLPATQKGYATRPQEARYRPAVEEWLKANGHG